MARARLVDVSSSAARSGEDEHAHAPATGYVRRASGVQRIELSADGTRTQRPAVAPTFHGPERDAKVILVVDDDDAVRGLVARTLATRYTIFEACDGVEATEILRDMTRAPHAIVCDVSMPRLDGVTLAKHVKSDPRLRSTPIVFVTARTGALDVIEGINAGARHYVTKPFKMADLLDKVSEVVSVTSAPKR